jgi:gas vesicle protein
MGRGGGVMDISKFGEGFYVTCLFMLVFVVIAITAMITGNEVAKSLIGTFGGIVGTIAAFWFATRGQTSGA